MTASSSCTKQGKLGTEQMRAVAIKDVVVHLKNVKVIEGTLCCMQPPQSWAGRLVVWVYLHKECNIKI